MKTIATCSLLLLRLAAAKSGAGSVVPFCVVECTEALTDQFSPAESLQVLCDDTFSQRALFQCLVDSCHAHAYGPALAHVVSTCSNFGLDISPLHPIEVHYATITKRQVLPTEPGPVIPSPLILGPPLALSFKNRLVMSLECSSGADGLLTLSVDVPHSMATPFGADGNVEAVGTAQPSHTTVLNNPTISVVGSGDIQGVNGTTACASLASSLPGSPSSLAAQAQSTPCSCHDGQATPVVQPPQVSVSLLQGTAESLSASQSASSALLRSVDLPSILNAAPSENCNKTSIVELSAMPGVTGPASSVVVATSIPTASSNCTGSVVASLHFPQPPNSTFYSPGGRLSAQLTTILSSLAPTSCLNSSSVRIAGATLDVSLGGSLSAAATPTTTLDTVTVVTTFAGSQGRTPASGNTTCSSDVIRTSLAQNTVPSISSQHLSANVSTSFSSQTSTRLTSVSVTTVAVVTSSSAWMDPNSKLPAYTVPALLNLPAYLPPLAAYSHQNLAPAPTITTRVRRA